MIDKERHLTGLIAAPHTPMNPDASITTAYRSSRYERYFCSTRRPIEYE